MAARSVNISRANVLIAVFRYDVYTTLNVQPNVSARACPDQSRF